MKAQVAGAVLREHAVQHECMHMHVQVQVQGSAEPLNDRLDL